MPMCDTCRLLPCTGSYVSQDPGTSLAPVSHRIICLAQHRSRSSSFAQETKKSSFWFSRPKSAIRTDHRTDRRGDPPEDYFKGEGVMTYVVIFDDPSGDVFGAFFEQIIAFRLQNFIFRAAPPCPRFLREVMAETPDAVTARSGEGQAFSRALKAQPAEIRKMYADLYSIEVKEAFRKTWSKNRSFDFVEKERVTIHGKTQLETEAGEWMTFTQLRTKLGAPDPQGEKDAEHYKLMCETEELKDQFAKANKMLGCDVYLYIAEVKQCTNVKEVKDIVRVLTKYAMSNTWMDQVQKDRACRAWASEKKVRMDSIKLEDIKGSPLGLKGWAAKYDEMSAASSPAPNTKAPKKSSKGGGKGKGGSTRNKAASTQAEEKKARELLASVSHTQHIMGMICKQAKEDENEQWLWAKPFLLEYQECLKKLQDFEANSGEFLTRLKLAIHIPAELRLMKKAGPNYV